MQFEKNQNKIFIVGFILILFVVVWSLARPGILKLFQKDQDSEKKINEEILKAPLITPKDLYERMKNKEKALLFDISSADDFMKGHLAMSENVPDGSLNLQKLNSSQAEKTSVIVLINQGDDVYEAAQKTNELVAESYVNAKYLQGGISTWKNQGYPLVSSDVSGGQEGKIKKINISDLAGDLSAGTELVQFVDVRSQEAFGKGHILGALGVPLYDLEKNQDKISSMKKVVVYGDGEDEASRAAVILFDLNFFNVYVLEGGLEAWQNAGGQIVAGSE